MKQHRIATADEVTLAQIKLHRGIFILPIITLLAPLLPILFLFFVMQQFVQSLSAMPGGQKISLSPVFVVLVGATFVPATIHFVLILTACLKSEITLRTIVCCSALVFFRGCPARFLSRMSRPFTFSNRCWEECLATAQSRLRPLEAQRFHFSTLVLHSKFIRQFKKQLPLQKRHENLLVQHLRAMTHGICPSIKQTAPKPKPTPSPLLFVA